MHDELTQDQARGAERRAALADVPERLARLQLAQIVHGRRAIVLFEGWDGGGRHGALRRVAAAWDPCHFSTHCADSGNDGRHWLARYWSSLPPAGHAALFTRSWYRELARERAHGRMDDKAWLRRCDEINEFESQQRDHGTIVVKLFFDVSRQVQAERLAAREADPWRRWLTPSPDGQPSRDDEQTAWSELFSLTDTRWAPWNLIDANDRDAAERTAMLAVCEAFEKAIPSEPPEAPAPREVAQADG